MRNIEKKAVMVSFRLPLSEYKKLNKVADFQKVFRAKYIRAKVMKAVRKDLKAIKS